MYHILAFIFFISCSFKNTEIKPDKDLVLKAMDSDGDQVSDFDEISRGTNRYVANIVIEKPQIKSLNLKIDYKLESDDSLSSISRKFKEIGFSNFQKDLISTAHHKHGNTLINQLSDPHKDSFKINFQDSDQLALKIDNSRLVGKAHLIKSILISGELKDFKKGSVYELFIGQSYIGAIKSKQFQINTTLAEFIKLVNSGTGFYLRVADFNIQKTKYSNLKRAILKNSRLISIDEKDRRVEYFVSKKIKNLGEALKQIFSKSYKISEQTITRIGTQASSGLQKFIVSSVGNPFKKLNSEVRISLVGNFPANLKSGAQASISSSSFENVQKLGIINRNSSLKILVRVNKQTGYWYDRRYEDYTSRSCPRTGCMPFEGNIRCSFEILRPKGINSELLLKPYSSNELHFFYLDINNKRHRLIDLLSKKIARFKIINSKEALIEFKNFESFFDGDETSELTLVTKGESKPFWEGVRVARYTGRITCLNATNYLMKVYKTKLTQISVGYKFIKDSLKLPSSRIGKKLTARIYRNIGYSYELKGGFNE